MSGRAGASLPPSPLRTERANFQALGSSNITQSVFSFDSVLYDDRIGVTRPSF